MHVGRNVVVLNDKSRKDPYSEDSYRAIITSVYYPAAEDKHNSKYVDLFSPSTDQAMQLLKNMEADIEFLNSLDTHIHNNATPKLLQNKTNIILYSPGFGVPRDMYSFHIQELVNSGFIVIAIGSTYESIFSIFPDGRLVKQVERLSNIKSTDFIFWREILNTRVKDIMYVIDHLDVLFNQTMLEELDYGKLGIVGHSLGGAAVFEAARRDDRIQAGVMLDASFHLLDLNHTDKVKTPFLIMRQEKCTYDELQNELSEGIIKPYVDNFEWLYTQLMGSKATVKVLGAQHMTFTDVPIHYKELEVSKIHEKISEYANSFLRTFLTNTSSLQNEFNKNVTEGIVEINYKGEVVSF